MTEFQSLCETEFDATKSISIHDTGVHTGTIFLLTSRMKITISGIQALVTNQVVEQAVEDRGKMSDL